MNLIGDDRVTCGFRWVNTENLLIGERGTVPRRVSSVLIDEMAESEKPIAKMSAGIELQCWGKGIESVRVRYQVVQDDGFPVAWSLLAGNCKVHPTRVVASGARGAQLAEWSLPERVRNGYLRLIFPTHAEIELLGMEVEPKGTAKFPERTFRMGRPRWLVHGDSITHGANVTSPDFTWIEQVARKLRFDPVNLGFGGIARAQEYMAREIARRKWDILSIHIGANSAGSSSGAYRSAYDRFLEIIRAAHPCRPVVCVTPIIHYSDEPGGDGSMERMREVIRNVVSARSANNPHLHLVEGIDLLDSLDGLLADGIHPSDHGAGIIAENLCSRLKPIWSGCAFSE